jgi:hypothetical protein
MMRKIFFIAVLAVGLAACNTGAFLTQVRQGAIKACHFDPAVSMIEAIIKATSGLDVTTIVGYVCRSVEALPTARLAARRGAIIAGAPSFVLNGKRILVQGNFVQ